MSCQAKDLGQLREAETLAETARAGYPGASPRVSAILDLRAAQAYAFQRSATECRKAIDRAFARVSEPASSTGEPGWCYWFDEAHANEQAGYCYLKLGDWSRARSHLRVSLRLEGAGFAREGALRRTLLATTYACQAQPDLDEAVSFGSQALDLLTSQVDSVRCVSHLNRLVEQLTPYRRSNLTVRQFTDRATETLPTPA